MGAIVAVAIAVSGRMIGGDIGIVPLALAMLAGIGLAIQ